MNHLDLILAILHHLLVFSLFAILFAELAMVRPGMDAAAIVRVQKIDAWYGVLAACILVVGFVRAIYAAKGWNYYLHNAFFWAKIGVFMAIGLVSVPPTLAFLRWRRMNILPANDAIARVQRYLRIEAALFPLLPAFAAAMARGIGEYS